MEGLAAPRYANEQRLSDNHIEERQNMSIRPFLALGSWDVRKVLRCVVLRDRYAVFLAIVDLFLMPFTNAA
jgi:hypothetical protein